MTYEPFGPLYTLALARSDSARLIRGYRLRKFERSWTFYFMTLFVLFLLFPFFSANHRNKKNISLLAMSAAGVLAGQIFT